MVLFACFVAALALTAWGVAYVVSWGAGFEAARDPEDY